ncbi:MAG TPA: hypothetical protein VMO04_04830, partial [Chthoniobacterales bacterium]|nr:hypothetical protein [Chthoniobacterales bacterium]
PADRKTSREASKANFDAVWQYVKPAIFGSNKAVRLYYRANCRVTKDYFGQEPVPFPFVKVQPPSKGKTSLTAIREIFKNDKNVTVREDSVGIIRIWIGKVPTAILQTKLTVLTLDPKDQYNPDDASGAILQTKEMQAAMGSLRFRTPAKVAGAVAEPMKGLPHLPASIRNVTMEQALDKIAKTWAGEGAIIYGVCGEPTEQNGDTLFSLDYMGDILPK